jgi:hypothetical protein
MQDFAAISNVLQEELGFPEGNLFEGIPLETANRLWLSKSFGKKFLPSGPFEKMANEACLTLFKENNAKCATFVLQPLCLAEEEVVERVKLLFERLAFCGPELFIDRESICSRFMTGPGASQLAISGDFYSKVFAGKLSYTSELLHRVYHDCLKAYPLWRAGEIFRSSTYGEQQVVGNRLSFAPKTFVISRSICTEPNLNMLFQKGLGSCVEDGLRRVFKIDLSKQPTLNRRMARIGSFDGSFGTIDLSSASDSMSLETLRKLIPPVVFKWFELTRSGFVTYPGGVVEQLHMISSMGNGFTFPLQTYLFSSIVVAAYQTLGVKPRFGKEAPLNFGVFGDDIVVRKDCYDFVIRCLELFGFSVNGDKSFNSGGFRESCGGDFLRSHEIRGVYLKSLNHDADVYSAINRLIRWSSRTGIMVPLTVAALRGVLRGQTLWIPWKDGDAEGIKVPTPPTSLKVAKSTQGLIYFALVKRKQSFRLPEDASDTKAIYPLKNGKRTKVFFNPDGLMVSVVASFIRSGRIMVRSDHDTFKIQRRITSSWQGMSFAPDASQLLVRLASLDQGNTGVEGDSSDLTMVGYLFSPGSDWEVVSGFYFN